MNIVSPQTFHLLSLMRLKGVGPAALKKAVLLPGFDRLRPEELATTVPQIARSLEGGANWQEAQDWAQTQVAAADEHGARILSAVDEEYPALLAATKDDPFIIFVQGVLAKPGQRSLAVIGTRQPTPHGAIVTRRITTHFGEAGWSIVSGLALGCDGLAHQAALDCGAHTVAVMAHGLHMTAPSKHKSLAHAILDGGGALVSEYPFGQDVQSQQYVKRDRTQAGMALGVVMVQSDLKGGSLYASRAALEYGRWLAVPYPTARDLETKEPKVQANLVIADGAPHERASLLRCNVSALERVIVLQNKEDYWHLADSNGIELHPRGEPALRHTRGIADDEPAESTETTGDFFSRLGPQPKPSPLEKVANPEPEASARGFNHNESGCTDESTAPDCLPVADIEASPRDAVPSEIVSEPEPNSRAVAADSLPVQALCLAPINKPTITEPLHTLGLAEDAQPIEPPEAQLPNCVEPLLRVQLDVSLPKQEEVGAAFGLWLPPKIDSRDFKKWLGDSADDSNVREFYARHRRLHTHLTDLQRKLISAKRPFSQDQLHALRLVSEEAVFHLSKLASASIAIEVLAKNELQRIRAEDWIEQNEAAGQLFESDRFSASEIRSSLVADSFALLGGNLKLFVIDGEDSDKDESLSGAETKQLKLSELVQRLSSMLLSTFQAELVRALANSTAVHGRKK